MPVQPRIRFRKSTSLSVRHENSNVLQTPYDHTLLVPQRLRVRRLHRLHRLLRPRIHHVSQRILRASPFAKTLHGPAAPARPDNAESAGAPELPAQLSDGNDARGAPWKCPVGHVPTHASHRHRRHRGCLDSNPKRVADYKVYKSLRYIQVTRIKTLKTISNVEYRYQNRTESFDFSL